MAVTLQSVNIGDNGEVAKNKINANDAALNTAVIPTGGTVGQVLQKLSPVDYDTAFSDLILNPQNYIDFTPQDPIPSSSTTGNRVFSDGLRNLLSYYREGKSFPDWIGVNHFVPFYNGTASTITSGTPVSAIGLDATYNFISVTPTLANNRVLSELFAGISETDVLPGGIGIALRFEFLAYDTLGSGWTIGDRIYVASLGGLTNVQPMAPDYSLLTGTVSEDGVISIEANNLTDSDTIVNLQGALNGLVTQKQSLDILVDTGVVYFETNNEEYPTLNLPFIVSDTKYLLDTTTSTGTGGKARIALTAGTITTPVINYVYIIESAGVGVLSANTTGFPANGCPVAVILLLDVASTNTDGALAIRRFNNKIDGTDADGILQYITKRLRLEGSKYDDGVDPTVSIVVNPSANDSLRVSTTSGIVYQLHEQTFSAQTGTEYYVVNHPTTPYLKISDLNQIDVDANGNTLRSNNTRYGLNIIGGQNSGLEPDRLYVMLPNGSYSSDANAVNDVNNLAVTSVPRELRGTAFRLFRIVVNYSTAVNGTITNLLGAGSYQDERGQPLGIGGGGSGSGASQTSFSDAVFHLFNSVDATKILNFDLSGISTGTTRTLTAPNISGTLAVSGMTEAFSFAGQVRGGSIVKTFSATPTFNFNEGNNQQITLTGNITSWTISNQLPSGSYSIWFIQDAVGGRTISAPTGIDHVDTSLGYATTANDINIVNIIVSPSGITVMSLVDKIIV